MSNTKTTKPKTKTKAAVMTPPAGTPVLVTTAHRGVFFGRLEARSEDAAGALTVTLTDARCAIYWATKTGFLELASIGPNERSKIGARAPRIELRQVTSITDCTPEAVTAWERA